MDADKSSIANQRSESAMTWNNSGECSPETAPEFRIRSRVQELSEEISSLKADLLAKDEKLKEAGLEIRAATRNRARLEDEIKALVRKDKAKASEIVRIGKENSLLLGQIELLRQTNDPNLFSKFTVGQLKEREQEDDLATSKEATVSESQESQSLRQKLEMCRQRLAEATKGWESCEDKASASTSKITELESHFISASDRIEELAALLSEQQKLNSNLSQDLTLQKGREIELHEQLMDITLQSALVKEYQDSTIKALSNDLETATALLCNERSRCQALDAQCQALQQQLDTAQRGRDLHFAEKTEMSSRCMVLEGIVGAMQQDLQRAFGQLRSAGEVQQRLNLMCDSEGAAMQKRLQEELSFCLELVEQHREKLRAAAEGWTTSMEKVTACERRVTDLERELRAATDRLEGQEAEVATLQRSNQQLAQELAEARCAAEAATREREQAREGRDKAQQDLERALRQAEETRAAQEARIESLSSSLELKQSQSAGLEGLLARAEAERVAAEQRFREADKEKSERSARCRLVEEVAEEAHAQLERSLAQLRAAEEEQERLRRVSEGRDYLENRALEQQLEQSMAQARRFQEKLNLAAIGWETCEGKVSAYKQRVKGLEGQLVAMRTRVAGLEETVQDLQNLNAVLSGQLAEATRPAASATKAYVTEALPTTVPGLSVGQRPLSQAGAQASLDESGRGSGEQGQGKTSEQLQRQVETLAAAYEASEQRRARMEKERGDLEVRCRQLEAEATITTRGRVALSVSAEIVESSNGGGEDHVRKDTLLLEQEVQRMARELEGRNVVETNLRGELFHALAQLAKAQEDLAESTRSIPNGADTRAQVVAQTKQRGQC